MKTIILTTAILSVLAFNTKAADGIRSNKKPANSVELKAPEFVFGAPEDIENEEVSRLRFVNFVAPATTFVDAADIDFARLETELTLGSVKAPAFVWGDANDLDFVRVNEKISFPVATVDFAAQAPELDAHAIR